VHVVGETIVDSYTYTTLIGGNSKTPTFSVRFDRQLDYVGGAGIVAKHLRAAGAKVAFTTLLGEDALGHFVLDDLKANDIEVNAIIDPTRPTTNKNAFIADNYRLLKVDKVDNHSISDKIQHQLEEHIRKTRTQAVVFSDFRHGIFNRQTIPPLIAALPRGAFRVADSQVASRWGNILEFTDFDLITPNEREVRFALGDQDSVIRPLGLELFRQARCKTLILKMGARGLITYRAMPKAAEDVRAFFVVDSFAQNIVDAVGAGDALLAYATLSMVATGNAVIASILGSLAAAVECEHDGNSPVRPRQVLEKLESVARDAQLG
jgi:rfaE bifunctional protein kinase chain/domain